MDKILVYHLYCIKTPPSGQYLRCTQVLGESSSLLITQ